MNDPLVVGYLLPLLALVLAVFGLFYGALIFTATYGMHAEEATQALERWLERQGLTVLSTRMRGGGPYHKIRVSDNLGQVHSGWAHVRGIQDRLKQVNLMRRSNAGDLPIFFGPPASRYKITLEWEGFAPFGVPLSGEISRNQFQRAHDLADEIDK